MNRAGTNETDVEEAVVKEAVEDDDGAPSEVIPPHAGPLGFSKSNDSCSRTCVCCFFSGLEKKFHTALIGWDWICVEGVVGVRGLLLLRTTCA